MVLPIYENVKDCLFLSFLIYEIMQTSGVIAMDIEISEKIKQFRMNNNLTLDKLAQITGVSRATLGRIESGLSNPTMKTVNQIEAGMIEHYMKEEFPDLDTSVYYSNDELASLFQFNSSFLDYRNAKLSVCDSGLEITSKNAESVNVTLSDLNDLMNSTINSYFFNLHQLTGISFEDELETE